ncbi:hypothetical protein GMD1E_10432, partial [Enterococcus sp. GMD1E]
KKTIKVFVMLALATTIIFSSNSINIGSVNLGTEEVSAATKYHAGVTKIVQRNWHVQRIYISKSTLRKAGNGLSVGGIWVPKFAYAAIIQTAGYALSNAPGGIWVDYDRLLSGFGGGFGAPHWQ